MGGDAAVKSRKVVGGALAQLRALRKAFDYHPAFVRWHAESALRLPDLADEIRAAGIDPRTLQDAIRDAEEATEYARAALEYRAWDEAVADIERTIAVLERIVEALGPGRTEREPRFRRGTALRLIRGSVLLLIGNHQRVPFAAWRRLDTALTALARSRRMDDPNRIQFAVETFAHPSRLRIHVRRAIQGVHRDVRAETARLLDEAEDAADYALAALEARAWPAARIDLDRLDAALRALRHIVQRESEVYLPEPWPLRLPARLLTTRAIRHEARAARSLSPEEIAEIEANVAAMTARATEAQARHS